MLDISYLLFAMQLRFLLPVGVSRGFACVTILRESPILKVARALKVFVSVADLFCFMLDISYLLFAMRLRFFLPVGVLRGFALVTIFLGSPIRKVARALKVFVSVADLFCFMLDISYLLFAMRLRFFLPVGVLRGFALVTIFLGSPILKVAEALKYLLL